MTQPNNNQGYTIQGPEEEVYGNDPYYGNQQYISYPPQPYYQQNQYYVEQPYDDDADNLAEIERELAQGGNHQGNYYPDQAHSGSYHDEDYNNLDEIEAEMYGQEQGYPSPYGGGYPQSPNNSSSAQNTNQFNQAAVPVNHRGQLTAHAAEFWFPESRNCECCKGFKHGCTCVASGGEINTCTKCQITK